MLIHNPYKNRLQKNVCHPQTIQSIVYLVLQNAKVRRIFVLLYFYVFILPFLTTDTNNIIDTNCCMIFIDEEAQIYQNWNEYKRKNSLPEGYILAPENGIYSIDEDNNVCNIRNNAFLFRIIINNIHYFFFN